MPHGPWFACMTQLGFTTTRAPGAMNLPKIPLPAAGHASNFARRAIAPDTAPSEGLPYEAVASSTIATLGSDSAFTAGARS